MKRLLIPLLLILLAGCGSSDTFTCQDGTRVRLTAVSDRIIHVEAVPEGARFSYDRSLAVVNRDRAGARISTEGNKVTMTTSKLKVFLNLTTGRVSFHDVQTGMKYAAEDRREFTPIETEGVKAWTVRQVFEARDEAFFGLGQHQADEWNYKGRSEELYQYNTKISIPFIVSSRNYGILWDSYSLCRWGDPREWEQLGDVFTLRDVNGEPGALTGTYQPESGPTLVRREPALAQEFLRTPECDVVRNAPEDFDFNGSIVLYEGTLEAPCSGTYEFFLYYAGYTKVFMDGEQVMPEIWRTAWNPNGRKFSFDFQEGVRVPVRIEWQPDGGVSYCALKAHSPLPEQDRDRMSWWGEMQDEIDYYFIAGDDMDGVIGGYRTLTGKAPIMPKWAMGYWQSRERYVTQDEVVGTLREFRDRHIPVDNIVQDWQYWEADQWGSHEFDAVRYPDPRAMVDSIHALGGRFMVSVWPKFYPGTEHFDELDAKGWIYRTAIRDSVEDWLGYQQSFYDAYAPGARKMFWGQLKDHLYPLGVDSWWMDASEPNIHDCTDMDFRKELCGPTALGPSTEYFNAYALMNARAIYEGQRASDNRRVFQLTRNGFAGLQRYAAASWSGDIGTRWEDMKAQISAGLNYSLSGIPWWGQDIGGFSVENRFAQAQRFYDASGTETPDLDEWREMQVRWHEWGVFCPLYRAHGQWPAREPWNIAPEGSPAYEAIVRTDRIRYKFLPYIYTLAARVHFEDYTPMRALCMDFSSDPEALEVSDEFMFGDAILVCPVYEYGARSREVYLPKGSGWYDGSDGSFHEGGTRFVADAPYERIPVFYRSGRIVVCGPDGLESTADAGDGSLNVFVYPGKDASFSLYEDDGLTYNYERNEYSVIPINWDESSSRLTIGNRKGRFRGMTVERDIYVTVAGKDMKSVRYEGSPITIEF